MRHWDGHSTAHTPDEMHQSSGEGVRSDRGLAAWGRVPKHGSRLETGPTMSLYPASPQALGHSGTDQVVQVLFVLGGLSQEGAVRVGFAPHFSGHGSHCHTTSNK